MLTRHDLNAFAPRPDHARGIIWDTWAACLIEHMPVLAPQYGIDQACELRHFMAQIAHESGGFSLLWESGAYRVDGLLEIFGEGRHSAGITRAEAVTLCTLPGEERSRAIFERVYGLGNPKKARELGNCDAGDGYRFRGYGLLQTTGRRDHERLLGGDASPRASLRAALAEWDEKHCNVLAAHDDLKGITKSINGGYNGLDGRRAYLAKAKRVWRDLPAGEPPPPATMAQSTTGNTAVVLGGGGSVTTATEVSGAVAKVATSGKPFSVYELVIALAQSPGFWIGVITVAGAAYVWLERRRKLVKYGI